MDPLWTSYGPLMDLLWTRYSHSITFALFGYIAGWFRLLSHMYAEAVNSAYPDYPQLTWRDIKKWLNCCPGIEVKVMGAKIWETLNEYVFRPMWGMNLHNYTYIVHIY